MQSYTGEITTFGFNWVKKIICCIMHGCAEITENTSCVGRMIFTRYGVGEDNKQ